MKLYHLMLLLAAIVFASCGQKEKSGFAIIVDVNTYNVAQTQVDAYAQSIEKQGLKTFIIQDTWHHPDSIRNYLKDLYKNNKLEGAVFIGDIPVPMIRGAQHMASAFKMDEDRFPMNRSSVPSDRFYEDFDLQFDFLKQDDKDSLLFYYNLKPESPQVLSPDIYSGRIKPNRGDNFYDLIKNYLQKVVEYKNNPVKVDKILFSTGHGYNSESTRSWMDEKITLNQQFDYLLSQQNLIEYINFGFDTHIKFRLLSELKKENLDLAFMHNHGGITAQYLNGMPETSSNERSIENIKYYLRSKLRGAKESGKNLDEAKKFYSNWLGIPVDWFEGTFDPEQIEKDSIFNANLDIYLEDMENYSSNAKFIQFDACFNGSFQKDQYISSAYIFDEGNTITVQANSVNVLQDKWPGEMDGLLGLGIRVGFWNQMSCLLETHIIGDPTLSFVSPDPEIDVNNWITTKANDINFWEKQLTSKYDDVQALALRMLYKNKGCELSDLYLKVFKESPANSVRTEAFKLLSFCKDQNFIEAINLGITDSYELIQRFSASYMVKNGDESHIPYLIDGLLQPNKGRRVLYQLGDAAGMYNKDLLLAELDKQIPQKSYLLDPEKTKAEIKDLIEKETGIMTRYINELNSGESTEKDKFNTLRSFRNMTVNAHLDDLISYVDTVKSERLKLTGIEMLGWFNYSSQRGKVEKFCDKMINDKSLSDACIEESIKTKNRVK